MLYFQAKMNIILRVLIKNYLLIHEYKYFHGFSFPLHYYNLV